MQNPSMYKDGIALPRFHTNNTSVGVIMIVNVAKEFIHIVPIVWECGCVGTVMSYTLLIVEELMIKFCLISVFEIFQFFKFILLLFLLSSNIASMGHFGIGEILVIF